MLYDLYYYSSPAMYTNVISRRSFGTASMIALCSVNVTSALAAEVSRYADIKTIRGIVRCETID